MAADRDPEVRAIVMTGAGRAFCAGLDLRAQSGGGGLAVGASPGEFELRDAPPIVLHNVDTPTICALNGGAAGYGMDLALGCDIRVAGESGKLAPAFTKRGVLPESGGTWLLPRLVGYAKAAEIAFTGRTLSAKECLDLGLVNRVVADAELPTAARGTGPGDRRQRAAGGAGHQADDADGRVRDVRAERAPRLPAAAAAVPQRGLQGGHGRLPREAGAELHRSLTVDLFDAIATTRAIRRFRPDPIPEADLATILFAASRAPSGSNRQLFRFVLLRDDETSRQAKALIGGVARQAWDAKRAHDGYDRGSGGDTESPKARTARAPCSTSSTTTRRSPSTSWRA